jgi:hypothetical protein
MEREAKPEHASVRQKVCARYTPEYVAKRIRDTKKDCDEYDADRRGNPIDDERYLCCARCEKTHTRCKRVAIEGYDWCWQHCQSCDNEYAAYKDLCAGETADGPPNPVVINGVAHKLFDLIVPIKIKRDAVEADFADIPTAQIFQLLQRADPLTLERLICGITRCIKARQTHTSTCYTENCAQTRATETHKHWGYKLLIFKRMAVQAKKLQQHPVPQYEFEAPVLKVEAKSPPKPPSPVRKVKSPPKVPQEAPILNVVAKSIAASPLGMGIEAITSSLQTLTVNALGVPKKPAVQVSANFRRLVAHLELSEEELVEAYTSWQAWLRRMKNSGLTFKEIWTTWLEFQAKSPTKRSPKKAV